MTTLHIVAAKARPADQEYICEIDFNLQPGGIFYTPWTCFPKSETVLPEPVGAILHFQLKKWLESKNMLWPKGDYCYEEFIELRLNAELIHEYLFDKKLTNLPYDSNLL